MAHNAVDAIGVQWLDQGVLDNEDALRLRSFLGELRELYVRHLDVEDNQVFPAAASVLSHQAQVEVGREMAARRGISAEVVKAALR